MDILEALILDVVIIRPPSVSASLPIATYHCRTNKSKKTFLLVCINLFHIANTESLWLRSRLAIIGYLNCCLIWNNLLFLTANPWKNVYKISCFGGEFQNKIIHTPCIQQLTIEYSCSASKKRMIWRIVNVSPCPVVEKLSIAADELRSLSNAFCNIFQTHLPHPPQNTCKNCLTKIANIYSRNPWHSYKRAECYLCMSYYL